MRSVVQYALAPSSVEVPEATLRFNEVETQFHAGEFNGIGRSTGKAFSFPCALAQDA